MNQIKYSSNNAPLPLVLGITGHRDIVESDINRVYSSIKSIFEDIKKSCPNTPIKVLSPLADGADRIAARVGLESGAELICPIPFSEEIYREDFNEESLKEFYLLKSKATYVFNVCGESNYTKSTKSITNDEKDKYYEIAGKYIADHCHILIAVWDNKDSHKIGGTTQIVKYRLRETPTKMRDSNNFLELREKWPVYHIFARRKSSVNCKNHELTQNIKPPKFLPLAKEYKSGFMNKFIRKIINYNTPKSGKELFSYIKERIEYLNSFYNKKFAKNNNLLEDKIKQFISGYTIPEELLAAVKTYICADAVAINDQKHTKSIWRAIFIMAAFMALIFESYISFLHNWISILFYFILFCLIILLWVFHNRYRYLEHFLDERLLAESLRIQIYWKLSGLKDDVTDQYLLRHIRVLSWVVLAVKTINMQPQPQIKMNINDIKKIWIEKQKNYFNKALERDKQQLEIKDKIAYFLYSAGILSTITLIILLIYNNFIPALFVHILDLSISLFPAAAALLIGFSEKMAYKEHVIEYQRMGEIYSQADKYLEQRLDMNLDMNEEEIRQFLLTLGREALYENAEWRYLHGQRPLGIPI